MTGRRTIALLALLTTAPAYGCRSQIALGDPDSGLPTRPTGPVVVPPRCTGVPAPTIVTVADPSLGEFRGMVVGGGAIHALFARPTGEGVLARVPTTGGTLTPTANVGLDPASLAISVDSSFVFVAARGSSQVFRVDSAGTVVFAAAFGAPEAVADDGHAGAFWTLPSNDTVFGYDFASSTPTAIATSPRPMALIRVANTLYIAGNGTLSAYELGHDGAPRKIADRCGPGAPASDGQTLYCAEADTIVRVDLASGVARAVAVAQPGARDLVLGAGRVFWRSAPSSAQTLVMALPLDGIGGPTLVESGAGGPLMLAIDGCDLYFTVGRAIVHRAL